MRHGAALPLALVALFQLSPVAAVAAPGTSVALDPYPRSQPSPLGRSQPPDFLDEDETVRARVDASGRVTGLVDDALIKIRGGGDYVVILPARVTQIADLGGDSVPGLQDGHVSFLGHATGQQQLGVEATLDMAQVKTLPVAVDISYRAGGRAIQAGAIPGVHGPVTVTVTARNLTAQPRQYVRGSAAAGPLAQVLEALRQASARYTPEVDLGGVLPVPATLALAPPTSTVTNSTFIPLTLTTTARLPAGTTVSAVTPGVDSSIDARGTRLAWVRQLPAAPGGPGLDSLSFTFESRAPRLPGLEVKADPVPLPAAVFTPPGGAGWSAYLARKTDRAAETLLAQEGMTSLHRIGELPQPLGRPGPGPVKVKYDFVLDSGTSRVAPPPPPPVRGQPVVVALAVAAAGVLVVGGARAWARH
jgi:hypothetical protein